MAMLTKQPAVERHRPHARACSTSLDFAPPSAPRSLARIAAAAALICAIHAPAVVAQKAAPAVAPQIQAPEGLTSPATDAAPPDPGPGASAPPAPGARTPQQSDSETGTAPGEPEAVAAPQADARAADEDARAAAAATLPHDLSPWGMFLAADEVVKGVMIGLVFASLVTWTIGLAKAAQLLWSRRRLARGLNAVLGAYALGGAMQAMDGRPGLPAAMLRTAAQELDASPAGLDHVASTGVQSRIASHLGRLEAQAARRMSAGTGLLATIGSTAPFVGLFGTVWGIMNSFIGISEAQTTNLAVVAPGIAEALLATALGLIAAIPAVVIYNIFARATAGYRALLADASAAVERLASRDLDHRRAALAERA